MKERTVIKIVVGLLATLLVMGIGGTDAIYPVSTLLFFALCVGYTEWCGRL